MATQSAPASDRFVTRPLLALAAVIFLANLPTLVVFDSTLAQGAAVLLYLGGALAIASALKLVALVARGGVDALSR